MPHPIVSVDTLYLVLIVGMAVMAAACVVVTVHAALTGGDQ